MTFMFRNLTFFQSTFIFLNKRYEIRLHWGDMFSSLAIQMEANPLFSYLTSCLCLNNASRRLPFFLAALHKCKSYAAKITEGKHLTSANTILSSLEQRLQTHVSCEPPGVHIRLEKASLIVCILHCSVHC